MEERGGDSYGRKRGRDVGEDSYLSSHKRYRSDHGRYSRSKSRDPEIHHQAHTYSDQNGNAHHGKHKRRRRSPEQKEAVAEGKEVILPYGSRLLVKADLRAFRPLLALYLDVQKGKDVEDMEEDEIRGRWKSFLGKWNRGELASGYYDPETLSKAVDAAEGDKEKLNEHRDGRVRSHVDKDEFGRDDRQSESEEEIGPSLPPGQKSIEGRRGPTIPNMGDLEMRRENSLSERQAQIEDLRYARKTDRKQQKEALEELLPRPDVGRDRQLEKKKLVNEKMKGFREGPETGVAEVPDEDLMGDDGGDSLRKLKKMEEKKKTEKQIRREERDAERREEREERLKVYRTKEDATLEMLKALKRQNFG